MYKTCLLKSIQLGWYLKIWITENMTWSWVRTSRIAKMSVLPKLIGRFNKIPTKNISKPFFVQEICDQGLKQIWQHKISRVTKTILNKDKAIILALSDFKLYYV